MELQAGFSYLYIFYWYFALIWRFLIELGAVRSTISSTVIIYNFFYWIFFLACLCVRNASQNNNPLFENVSGYLFSDLACSKTYHCRSWREFCCIIRSIFCHRTSIMGEICPASSYLPMDEISFFRAPSWVGWWLIRKCRTGWIPWKHQTTSWRRTYQINTVPTVDFTAAPIRPPQDRPFPDTSKLSLRFSIYLRK